VVLDGNADDAVPFAVEFLFGQYHGGIADVLQQVFLAD
jgi:hypothetical protein